MEKKNAVIIYCFVVSSFSIGSYSPDGQVYNEQENNEMFFEEEGSSALSDELSFTERKYIVPVKQAAEIIGMKIFMSAWGVSDFCRYYYGLMRKYIGY